MSLVNRFTGALMNLLMQPLRLLPDWAALLVLSALTGALLLVIFRYTSNQAAFKRLAERFRADLLSLRLFPEHPALILRCQGRMLHTAMLRLFHSLLPLAVMTVPVILLLAQMSVWFEHTPLRPGQEALLTADLTPAAWERRDQLEVEAGAALTVELGPLEIPEKRQLNWRIRAGEPGAHRLVLQLASHEVSKQVTVGQSLAPVSAVRPAGQFLSQLLNPHERPIPEAAGVTEVGIHYPKRSTALLWWQPHWIVSYFIVSLVGALLLRPVMRVEF
jgi:hypothetical protein